MGKTHRKAVKREGFFAPATTRQACLERSQCVHRVPLLHRGGEEGGRGSKRIKMSERSEMSDERRATSGTRRRRARCYHHTTGRRAISAGGVSRADCGNNERARRLRWQGAAAEAAADLFAGSTL